MLLDFKTFSLFEANDFRNKIKKFINIPDIYNIAHYKSPKYSVWIANIYKQKLENWLKSNPKFSNKSNDILKNGLSIINNEEDKAEILNYINIIKEKTSDKLSLILDWLNSDLREEKVNLTQLSWDDAIRKAEQFHKELEATGETIENETGEIFMKFVDGYYWIDLKKRRCEDEAKSMGHCGTTSKGDTLLSLRDSKKRPHVTIAYGYGGIIYQIKGKNNTKPIDTYHPYIVELLKAPNNDTNFCELLNDDFKVEKILYEYSPEGDFELDDLYTDQKEDIEKSNPELEIEEYDEKAELRDMLEDMDIKEIAQTYGMRHILNNIEDGFLDDYIDNEVDYYLSSGYDFVDSWSHRVNDEISHEDALKYFRQIFWDSIMDNFKDKIIDFLKNDYENFDPKKAKRSVNYIKKYIGDDEELMNEILTNAFDYEEIFKDDKYNDVLRKLWDIIPYSDKDDIIRGCLKSSYIDAEDVYTNMYGNSTEGINWIKNWVNKEGVINDIVG